MPPPAPALQLLPIVFYRHYCGYRCCRNDVGDNINDFHLGATIGNSDLDDSEIGASHFLSVIAVALAIAAWVISGESVRFLAVLVVATPCPLLIAIPVAIIGSISLSARRGIIIRDPVVLERIDTCRTAIFDKTGTLTYGEPRLTEQIIAEGLDPPQVLSLVASMEQYSKHPLAGAITKAATRAGIALQQVHHISEPPGAGMTGQIDGRTVRITSRKRLTDERAGLIDQLPDQTDGLECVVLIDDEYAATYRFREGPTP